MHDFACQDYFRTVELYRRQWLNSVLLVVLFQCVIYFFSAVLLGGTLASFKSSVNVVAINCLTCACPTNWCACEPQFGTN